jgi:uncharacterized membrane protein YkoI
MTWRFPSARLAGSIAATVIWLSSPPAGAEDHDAVRRAAERGAIRPLAEILAAIRDKLPGEVVGVEVEQKNGRWLYEFRVIDTKGRLFEVYVDARTSTVERIKEK